MCSSLIRHSQQTKVRFHQSPVRLGEPVSLLGLFADVNERLLTGVWVTLKWPHHPKISPQHGITTSRDCIERISCSVTLSLPKDLITSCSVCGLTWLRGPFQRERLNSPVRAWPSSLPTSVRKCQSNMPDLEGHSCSCEGGNGHNLPDGQYNSQLRQPLGVVCSVRPLKTNDFFSSLLL